MVIVDRGEKKNKECDRMDVEDPLMYWVMVASVVAMALLLTLFFINS